MEDQANLIPRRKIESRIQNDCRLILLKNKIEESQDGDKKKAILLYVVGAETYQLM